MLRPGPARSSLDLPPPYPPRQAGEGGMGETARSAPKAWPHRLQPVAPGVFYRSQAPRPPSQRAPATTRIFELSTFEPLFFTADFAGCVFGGRLFIKLWCANWFRSASQNSWQGNPVAAQQAATRCGFPYDGIVKIPADIGQPAAASISALGESLLRRAQKRSQRDVGDDRWHCGGL